MKIKINESTMLIDKMDYQRIKDIKLRVSVHGYAVYWEPASRLMVSIVRKIMDCPKGMEVDHINRIRLDNRRKNLRLCTEADNNKNKEIYKNNKSGFKGVSRHMKTWRASICYEKKRINLGNFVNKIDAARAYNEAAKRYFGEFAKINAL